MALRIDNVKVSAWLQDRPGNHSFVENQDRPVLGVNLYNPSDQAITITIPPKTAAYLPGLFANSKYAKVQTKLTEKYVTVRLPIGAGSPVFNSGKPKTA